MGNFIGYRCSLCGKEYQPEQVTYTCPADGGNLDVVMDADRIGKGYSVSNITSETEASIWRYILVLPVPDPDGRETPLRAVGWTPVYSPKKLANALHLENLWIKDESRNPTASFKDRASALVIARARAIDADVVITASTGNAGAALAGMAAAVGHQAVILAPRTAPPAKVAMGLKWCLWRVIMTRHLTFPLRLPTSSAGTAATLAITHLLLKVKRPLPWRSGSRCCWNMRNLKNPCVFSSQLAMEISYLEFIKDLKIWFPLAGWIKCRVFSAFRRRVLLQLPMPLKQELKSFSQ
jgi:hypothetical protein